MESYYNTSTVFYMTVLSLIVHEFIFITFTLLYSLIEYFNFFNESKLRLQVFHTSRPSIKAVCIQLFFNHIIFEPPNLFLIFLTTNWLQIGLQFAGPLPSWITIVFQIVCFMVIEDCGFYWVHRLFHTPYLYKRFHKQHHSFIHTHPLAAEYFHPVEYFATGIPILAGPFLFRTHIYVFWIWLFIRIWEAIDGHCGYDLKFIPFRYFPFRPTALIHSYHHSHSVGNYGSFTVFWDWLCGTDISYKSYTIAQKKKIT